MSFAEINASAVETADVKDRHMDDEAFHSWGVAIRTAGIDAFATDIVGFPVALASAPVGRIGHNDRRLLAALGTSASWLNDADVQARLGAILFYQTALRQPASIPTQAGQVVKIDNPLFGATLLADIDQEGDAVTRILADAARLQVDYLALAAAIPEWCEFRIYQLSSAPSRQITWLPRNRRQRRRRISAIMASQRR